MRQSRLTLATFGVALLASCTYPMVSSRDDFGWVALASSFEGEDWVKSFEPSEPLPWRQGKERTEVVFDEERRHNVLEVRYPKGGVGPGAGGAQWISRLPIPSERMTISYWVRFPTGFDWVLGGKLPGLIGGRDEKSGWPITGGIHPTGKNGWSARIMWKKNGEIVQYVYHLNQPGKYGDELKWKSDGVPAHFIRGAWQKLTSEVTLNEPGSRDGRIRSWLGEKLVLDAEGLEFRSTPELKIDAFCFSTFFGGEDRDWAPTRDEGVRFDEFRIRLAQ